MENITAAGKGSTGSRVQRSTPCRRAGALRIATATRAGMVKKTAVQELPGPSSQLFTLVKVNGGDALIWAGITDGDSELFLATETGMAIRFDESEVRPMGLVAAGVNGVKLKAGDSVSGAERLVPGDEILLLASNGRGWRSTAEEFPLQGRYGQGVIACKLPRGVNASVFWWVNGQ
jgi:DNA gyrase subunit A